MRVTDTLLARGLLLLAGLVLASCSHTTAVVSPPVTVPTAPDSGFYHFSVNATNLPKLSQGAGTYTLWLRLHDSSYRSAPLTFNYTTSTSTIFSGRVQVMVDSVISAAISLETSNAAMTPSAVIIAGRFNAPTGLDTLLADAPEGIGDYSTAKGSVFFTTQNADDTARAHHEFYLMRDSAGQMVSSLRNLGDAPEGWTYGVWLVNDHAYPARHVFYGAFTHPGGPDSRATGDSFPFPGGYDPGTLEDPAASIILSLDLTVLDSRPSPAAPGPFTVLSLPLSRFLSAGEVRTMTAPWYFNQLRAILSLYK